MPRNINATFISEKNKRENTPIFLYTIYNYNGAGSNLYFAEWDADVVFNGITYLKFPITHDSIGENIVGEIDKMRIKLSNVSREIQAYLEAYDWRKKKVSVKIVWANQLSDTSAYLEDIFYIDSYSADQNNVNIVLASKLDVLGINLPTREYWRTYCTWKFKSTECGYTGGETSCNKTKTRCKQLNNYRRFGGFPSIPSHRVYVG